MSLAHDLAVLRAQLRNMAVLNVRVESIHRDMIDVTTFNSPSTQMLATGRVRISLMIWAHDGSGDADSMEIVRALQGDQNLLTRALILESPEECLKVNARSLEAAHHVRLIQMPLEDLTDGVEKGLVLTIER